MVRPFYMTHPHPPEPCEGKQGLFSGQYLPQKHLFPPPRHSLGWKRPEPPCPRPSGTVPLLTDYLAENLLLWQSVQGRFPDDPEAAAPPLHPLVGMVMVPLVANHWDPTATVGCPSRPLDLKLFPLPDPLQGRCQPCPARPPLPFSTVAA